MVEYFITEDIPTLREMLVEWIDHAISGLAELPDNGFAAALGQVARAVPSLAVSQHLDKAANAALGADPFDLAN